MPVAKPKKKARSIGIGDVYEEKRTGRYVRVESMTRTEAVVSERYSKAGRFSAVTSRVKLKEFMGGGRFKLWRAAV